MKHSACLDVSYRNGKAIVAYVTLGPIAVGAVKRSERRGAVVIDFDAAGAVVGMELLTVTPQAVSELRNALQECGFADVVDTGLSPLQAA